MDDRTWYLAIGTLIASVFVVVLDAVIAAFQTPPGFFPMLGVMLGFLGAKSAFSGRRNGKNGDSE